MVMEDVRSALQPAFDRLLEELRQLEAQAKGKKMALNEMAKSMGDEIPFPNIEDESLTRLGRPNIRMDRFLGRPLATAVEDYLTLSGKEVGARPWSEIVQVLRQGGFELGKAKTAEDAARTTILKNTTKFKLVGDDAFGLLDWYPKIKREQSKDENSTPKKRGRPKKVVDTDKVEAKKPGRPKKVEHNEQSGKEQVAGNEAEQKGQSA
jgi:hypothetical protein